MTHLILDGAGIDTWQKHHSGGLLIPDRRRPSVLQADRETAEREAMRLGALHDGLFVVFAPVAMVKRVPEATHVNLRGEVLHTRHVARLLSIAPSPGDDEMPF